MKNRKIILKKMIAEAKKKKKKNYTLVATIS